MKNSFLFLLLILCTQQLLSQDKFFTKTGTITIDATTNASLETVHGINRAVSAVLDLKTGNLLFIVLMKGFEFQKALMQEHFNENYVESDKYPKADFKGLVENISALNLSKDGRYLVNVTGMLTMHGRTNRVEAKGTLEVNNGKISASATFPVVLKDYDITVPGLVADKVSKTATIMVDCTLEPFKG
jgi:hypothetical protein